MAFSATAAKSHLEHRQVKSGYNFRLYTPDATLDDEVEAKPVIIFLHGASLCGNNLSRVKRYGTIDAIEKGLRPDAYVIAPQNPGGAWNPEKIMNVFDYVADNHNVDYDRVYVIGMSLGGYGSIDLAATYPDQIAAAMAFCGGGSVKDLSGLTDVPLWIVHGTADRAVSVSQSDKVVASIKAAAGSMPPPHLRPHSRNEPRPAGPPLLSSGMLRMALQTFAERQRPPARRRFQAVGRHLPQRLPPGRAGDDSQQIKLKIENLTREPVPLVLNR